MENRINYNKLAKQYDKKGEWAIRGMDSFIAQYFNIVPYSCSGCKINSSQAIEYITETYLECIDSISFEDWITKGNEDGKVLIISEWDFKEKYSEIFEMNDSLQGAIDDIALLYGCEWWIFGIGEYESVYLATTTYKDYKPINIEEIERAMASFDVLLSLNAVTDIRRQKFIKRINQASNNVLDDYDTDNMTHSQLFEEVDRIFGMGYCSGFHQEWEITDKKSEINQ